MYFLMESTVRFYSNTGSSIQVTSDIPYHRFLRLLGYPEFIVLVKLVELRILRNFQGLQIFIIELIHQAEGKGFSLRVQEVSENGNKILYYVCS